MARRSPLQLVTAWLLPCALAAILGVPAAAAEAPPWLLVHYMPWYASRESSGHWGWHWTMDHFDPDRRKWDGRREIASHDEPLIGPYDSGDEQALECHSLLMKLAGIDGVVIDWYGTGDAHDHPLIHRNLQRLLPWLRKAGLTFAVCYEDRPLGSLPPGRDLAQVEEDLGWVAEHLFPDPLHLRHEGRPLLFVFGPQHPRWTVRLESRPVVVGLPHLFRERGFDGAFAWPPVEGGRTVTREQWTAALAAVYADERTLVATAFPGFKDIYAQAGVRDSYGSIDADSGRTLAASLEQAFASGKPFVQVATWNDFGEGTMIEPTRGQGYRALEALPRCGPKAHLRLPVRLYELRKRGGDPTRLDEAADRLFAGDCREAEEILAAVGRDLAATAVDGYRLATDLPYRENADAETFRRCRLDVYAPASGRPFPTVVWFHGGGLTQGERSIPMPLRGQDVAVVAASYRLAPEAESPAFIEDAAAAIAWTFRNIAAYGGDQDRIFVSGHSAGAYLGLLCGLDRTWLEPHGIDADRIAGLAPLSPQVITHFTIRAARGIPDTRPVIDALAPLFHVRKDAPPILLVTGDRDRELLGRYEECAYFGRMMRLVGHRSTVLHELEGFDHGGMPEPAFPLLLRLMRPPPRPPSAAAPTP